MNNYEYIIACLPVLQADWNQSKGLDADAVTAEIREQLSGKDLEAFDFLLDGFDPDKLCEDFYRKAARSGNGFIREYFAYDLGVRNAKVAYLNKSLGRPEDMDMIVLSEDEFEDWEATSDVLSGTDILERERGLDDLMWARIEDLTQMHVFDLDVILGFEARLKIVDRWLKLDPQTGWEMFRKLVEEIRNNR